MRAAAYQGRPVWRIVELADAAGSWRSGPVLVARSWSERRRGLAPRPAGMGLLVAARSVHSLTMAVPIGFAGLDVVGTVVLVGRLDPGRIVRVPTAVWILETVPGHSLPATGTVLGAVPILAGCPAV